MTTYEFQTGNALYDAVIETESSKDYYFGMYITCKSVGLDRRWFSIRNIDAKKSAIILFSDALDKRVGVTVPTDIIEAIMRDYNRACCDTGKIVVASIINASNVCIKRLYGRAKAVPLFKGDIWYEMPNYMERSILLYSADGKVYNYGGVEEEPRADDLLCRKNKTELWFKHFVTSDPFDFDAKAQTEDYQLILEVVELID